MTAAGERVLRILTGPTAVGKTEWALRWAEANGAEIISCDSLLFYRGMDIGTAKPSAGDLRRVRHHLVDIREVADPMNAAAYAELALAAALDIAGRGRRVLVVGGSGFYLGCFLGPVSDGIEVPQPLRERISLDLGRLGLGALVTELLSLNPAGLGSLDCSNPRRVASALGRCLASGRTLAELGESFRKTPGAFDGWDVRITRIDRPAPELELRIAERVKAMLGAGLLEEVRGLLGRGLRENPSAARAIGYRESIEVLDGRLPAGQLAERIARDTRALVKKQRTWFRTQLPPHRVVDASGLRDASELFLG